LQQGSTPQIGEPAEAVAPGASQQQQPPQSVQVARVTLGLQSQAAALPPVLEAVPPVLDDPPEDDVDPPADPDVPPVPPPPPSPPHPMIPTVEEAPVTTKT
jgi:hypothetical protein